MLNKYWVTKSMTFKATILALAIVGGSAASILGAKTAMAATLKPVSIITDESLKLGDIFDGIKRNADYVIGPAPQPGQDMTLNARTLYRIASALDVSWRPISTNDQITIRRKASVVPFSQIEKTLRNQLIDSGVSGNFTMKMRNGDPTIALPDGMPQTVEISSIEFDAQKDFFEATLVSPSADNPIKKVSVSGIVERLVSVPILRNNLRNGDIIGAHDIEMIDVNQHELQHNIIMDADDLIGLTPRRVAYAGKFVQAGTLGRPQLVKRGEKVSITFKEGPLVLTAKGKALQAGSKGDYIRVTNVNSSRTVDALVTGENQVSAQ